MAAEPAVAELPGPSPRRSWTDVDRATVGVHRRRPAADPGAGDVTE
ncbi:hypothetical protein [Streptomyces adustus]|nr:hypothetical protein [Streptomyces adustus]